MVSRALVLAAALWAAAAVDDQRFGTQCRAGVCGGGGVACCFDDMAINTADGTCSNATYVCGLCDQDNLPACPKCRSVAPITMVRDGVADDVRCWDEAGSSFGASGVLPLVIPRTDGAAVSLGTFNYMQGWTDVPSSAFFGFSEFLLDLTAYIPHYTQSANFEISLRCDKESIDEGVKGCSLFFFVYRCPPCAAHTGRLEEDLLAVEYPMFQVNRCGAKFKLHPEGAEHQFALYSAEVKAPFTFSVLLREDLAFTFWAIVGQTVVCSGIETEEECRLFPINCVWDEKRRPPHHHGGGGWGDDDENDRKPHKPRGVCRSADCEFRPGFGPGPKRCGVCVDEELIPVPPYTN